MSEWDGDVVNVSHKLSDAQVARLLAMTDILGDEVNLAQILAIKSAIRQDDNDGALQLWLDFSEAERIALWVAPKFGGIWTVEERKQLKPETRSET